MSARERERAALQRLYRDGSAALTMLPPGSRFASPIEDLQRALWHALGGGATISRDDGEQKEEV